MSEVYTPNADNFPTSYTIPTDGQGPGIKAADVDPALEGLADAAAYLKKRLEDIGWPHPIRVGTTAAMQALTAVDRDVFLVRDGADGDDRPGRLYFWDADRIIADSPGAREPMEYTGASSVELTSPARHQGFWVLVRPPETLLSRATKTGTGDYGDDSAAYSEITLDSGNMEVSFPAVRAGDIIQVRATISGAHCADPASFIVRAYDGGWVDVPGAYAYIDITGPSSSVVLVGEYVVTTDSGLGDFTVAVFGKANNAPNTNALVIDGACALFVHLHTP